MTWKEFKAKVEEKGVKDDHKLGYIDGSFWHDDVTVEFEYDEEDADESGTPLVNIW